MIYWLRTLWEWIVFFVWYNKYINPTEFKKMIDPDYEHTYNYTCLPTDLDMNLHMNNAVYFTALEFARVRYGMEVGYNKYALDNGCGFILAGNGFQYRREVGLFQTMQVKTRVMAIDDKWMYFSQSCFVKGKFVGRGVARMALIKNRKVLGAKDVAKSIAKDDEIAEQILSRLCDPKRFDHPQLKSFIDHQDSIKEGAL